MLEMEFRNGHKLLIESMPLHPTPLQCYTSCQSIHIPLLYSATPPANPFTSHSSTVLHLLPIHSHPTPLQCYTSCQSIHIPLLYSATPPANPFTSHSSTVLHLLPIHSHPTPLQCYTSCQSIHVPLLYSATPPANPFTYLTVDCVSHCMSNNSTVLCSLSFHSFIPLLSFSIRPSLFQHLPYHMPFISLSPYNQSPHP